MKHPFVYELMTDISEYEHFVMAGSMDSFHEPFDPLFDLAVHVHADWDVRRKRIKKHLAWANTSMQGAISKW